MPDVLGADRHVVLGRHGDGLLASRGAEDGESGELDRRGAPVRHPVRGRSQARKFARNGWPTAIPPGMLTRTRPAVSLPLRGQSRFCCAEPGQPRLCGGVQGDSPVFAGTKTGTVPVTKTGTVPDRTRT